MQICDKCLTDQQRYVKYAYPDGEKMVHVSLCHLCDREFGTNLLPEFMKEDFGSFPLHQISKDMINARKKRGLGQSSWGKADDSM